MHGPKHAKLDPTQAIRALGRSFDSQTSLPNTAALLRARAEIKHGLKIRQDWSEADAPGQSGWWEGEVVKKKPGHGQLCAVKYSNGQEMWILKSEEQSFRGHIIAHKLAEWQPAVDKITPAFEYIETRLIALSVLC